MYSGTVQTELPCHQKPGVIARLRALPLKRNTPYSGSYGGPLHLLRAAGAAVFAGGRRIRQGRHRPISRLGLFAVTLEPQQQNSTEVLVDFEAFVKWLVELERRRGKCIRTYRSLDRRVRSLMRRLRVQGVELCFVLAADPTANCCSKPEDAFLWLAEEQIVASLLRARCSWKQCTEARASDVLSRLVEDEPNVAAVFGGPQLSQTVVDGLSCDSPEAALERLAVLAEASPQPSPQMLEPFKAQMILPAEFGDVGPDAFFPSLLLTQQGASSELNKYLVEFASFLMQQPFLQRLRCLPAEAKAWLMERAVRSAGLGDTWLAEWAQLAEKLLETDISNESQWNVQEFGLAAASLLARSVPVLEEELEALAWMVELMKPRRQPSAFYDSVMTSLDLLLQDLQVGEAELGERAAAIAVGFQEILRGLICIQSLLALEKPSLVEPRDCFDDTLYRKLLVALQAGADLQRHLGGPRRPGTSGKSGKASLAATRAKRLARLLTSALPLASDDEQEREEKISDLILREKEVKSEFLQEKTEEAKFSASAWRESRGIQRTEVQRLPKRPEKLLSPEVSPEVPDVPQYRPKVRSSLAKEVAARTPPPGNMWFIPGKTETAQSKNKRQEDVTQAAEKEEEEEAEEEEEEEEEKEKEEEEKKEADSEAKVQQKRLQQNQAEAELLQEAWKNLEDDRQLARAMAHDTLPKFWENLWDEAPDSIFKENAWEQLESRKAGHPEEELPIEGMRSKIVEHVRDHRATILVGATGCGKSTRLPQYIMDEPRASVLVTQPRRVAAVEIAKRVASERGEPVGQNVGYRISGETLVGSGKLQFATIGYVLTWFLANPEQFGKFSHIVIDEVHERGADMELFLLLTKLLMYLFPRPKVILMSATMQPDEFRSYYSDFAIGEPLSVPGRTFPVEELFLDDLLSEYSDSLPPSVLTLLEAAAEQFEQLSEDDLKSPSILPGLLELAVQLCPHFAQPDSTMLIFLPGLLELNKLSDLFSEVLNAMPRQTLQGLSSFKTFVLHSMVPRTEQEEVFKPPTGGRCHVVLASNIAESSLTLPRVTTVIDFGLHREPVFDAKQGLNCLCTTWCSHASVRQRSGRAGRTQPGVALRLFTRRIFEETMAEFDTPEILRTSLSRLFLRAKRLSEVLQKTAAKISAQCPLDLSSARALLGSLPQPPSAMLVRSAVRELANSGALAAPTEEADITSLGMLIDGLPLEVGPCRLIWFGMLWGCTVEAVVMAAGCSSKDPFNSPNRTFADCDEAYLKGLRLSWMARRRFDGGHYSEPIMLLRLFAYWVMNFEKLSKSQVAGRPDFVTAIDSISKNANVHPRRFRDFLANVGDLADRARLLPDSSIPGDRDTIRHDLDRLLAFLNGHCASLPLCAKSIKLRALLAAAFSEQLLIGRRFIDQLRAPKRPSGRAASVLSGPRTAEEEEEEAQAFGHPSDETERDDAEDGFDLEEELAAIDKIDEEELGLDDDEEAPEDLEDDEVPTGEDEQIRLTWKQARDEMISAVNSLPLKGRMVHKRVVVAKLRKSAQDAAGSVNMKRLPDVMKKLAGRTPQHVTCKGKDSEFAAVCFPPEIVKELDLPGPAIAKPPTLDGATPSASISHSFSMGAFFIDFDGDLVARPSSPYQLSFFLPERSTSSEEERQQQIRGVLEARNPVGFPCHVNAGDDFFCTAASMQLLGSRSSVRVNGVTIFRAVEILFAITALCPERTFMSAQLGPGTAGDSPSFAEHILAVKISGWEISLLGDERGEGGGVLASNALEALQAVRESIRASLLEPAKDAAGQMRKLPGTRSNGNPEEALDKLLEVVSEVSERLNFSIDHGMKFQESVARGKKRRTRMKEAARAEVLLTGEETRLVDFLRPLEFCTDPAVAEARYARKWKAPAAKFQCPICQEVFARAKACREHLEKTGHLRREAGRSWRSLMEEQCLLE